MSQCFFNHDNRCHNMRKMHKQMRVVTTRVAKNGMSTNCKNCDYKEVSIANVQRYEPGETENLPCGLTESLF